MKVGILGGTFNPPHIGHLILAQETLDKAGLDRIFFIPTNIPPHKNAILVKAEHRLNMVKLSLKENRNFSLLDLEVKRGGVSYTIDTVKELKKKFPRHKFYLIIGSDLAKEFHAWEKYREIQRLVKIIVASREAYPFSKRENFILMNILQINISSSLIRGLLQKGFSVKYLVHPDVEKYIKKNKLYI
ncbi:MAG: nicotinate (nicotinamide) nucleotide adenylyltransferase [Candidatus Omnitrophica bacterium]|nr:nicotinate (nicotinamide) nucleotide adenylyltransferase [Candidatus Omnitrophota bacterium]